MIYFPGCGTTNVSDEHAENEKFASTIKNFISFISRRCNKELSGEDFIHPTLEDPVAKPKNDQKCPQKKSYFLSRGQQNELRKQSESCPSKNENPAERMGTQSSNQESACTDIHETTQRHFICSANTTKTSSSNMTSHGMAIKEIKEKVAVLCCDKCDGCHETDNCPYYKKTREVHLDGQKNGWKLIGEYSTLPGTKVDKHI